VLLRHKPPEPAPQAKPEPNHTGALPAVLGGGRFRNRAELARALQYPRAWATEVLGTVSGLGLVSSEATSVPWREQVERAGRRSL
jgi:hypothetical protein